MRYIKKVLEKNKAIAAVYIGLGIGSSFLTGYNRLLLHELCGQLSREEAGAWDLPGF